MLGSTYYAQNYASIMWTALLSVQGVHAQAELINSAWPTSIARILLANCSQEAECVNSQVMPCNTVPSG